MVYQLQLPILLTECSWHNEILKPVQWGFNNSNIEISNFFMTRYFQMPLKYPLSSIRWGTIWMFKKSFKNLHETKCQGTLIWPQRLKVHLYKSDTRCAISITQSYNSWLLVDDANVEVCSNSVFTVYIVCIYVINVPPLQAFCTWTTMCYRWECSLAYRESDTTLD